jgi:hypothetical protein
VALISVIIPQIPDITFTIPLISAVILSNGLSEVFFDKNPMVMGKE